MKYLIALLLVFLLVSGLYAETYTGRAENVKTNDRGIEFVVVVENSKKEEVLRRGQWLSTGVYAPDKVKEAVKKVVEKMTIEIWAHIEGAKQAIVDKEEIENYRVECSTYVPTTERPSPSELKAMTK